jgi:hypothetical protein
MKKFLINIYAYDHHGRFEVESNDDAISLEKAIVDKLGEKSINWESSGMFRDIPYRITYEEVINDTRPIQTKRSLELKWEQEHLDNGRYTLEMVRIDDKVKEVITKIKLEEAAIAHRQNTIEGAAPQVSVAT